MKNVIFAGLMLACFCISLDASAQLKVGRTKDQINADNAKATPKLIGTNGPLGIVSSEYELYRVGESTEILSYKTNTNGTGKFTFSSVSEEKDVYEYVLGLFDNFKNNEFFVGKTRIVPMKMGNFLGTKNIAFDINPEGESYTDKTLVIGKAGWQRLFKKSIIHEK